MFLSWSIMFWQSTFRPGGTTASFLHGGRFESQSLAISQKKGVWRRRLDLPQMFPIIEIYYTAATAKIPERLSRQLLWLVARHISLRGTIAEKNPDWSNSNPCCYWPGSNNWTLVRGRTCSKILKTLWACLGVKWPRSLSAKFLTMGFLLCGITSAWICWYKFSNIPDMYISAQMREVSERSVMVDLNEQGYTATTVICILCWPSGHDLFA